MQRSTHHKGDVGAGKCGRERRRVRSVTVSEVLGESGERQVGLQIEGD